MIESKFECKECGKIVKRLTTHVNKYHFGIEQYLKKHYDYDVVKKYITEKLSTPIIAEKIREFGFLVHKSIISDIIKASGHYLRSPSEATKEMIIRKGGVWNKGLDKEKHPSILAYASTRTGKNNPIYTGMTETIRQQHLLKMQALSKLPENIKKSKETTKRRRTEGKIKSFWETFSSEKIEKIKAKRRNTRSQRCYEYKLTWSPSSRQEKLIGIFLDDFDILYKKNFSLYYIDDNNSNRYYQMDYLLLEHNLILEFNGSYWHCDPRKYKHDYYHSVKKMFAKDIWTKDDHKRKLSEENGFRFETIWEFDVVKLNDDEYKEYIYEFLKSKINFKIKT